MIKKIIVSSLLTLSCFASMQNDLNSKTENQNKLEEEFNAYNVLAQKCLDLHPEDKYVYSPTEHDLGSILYQIKQQTYETVSHDLANSNDDKILSNIEAQYNSIKDTTFYNNEIDKINKEFLKLHDKNTFKSVLNKEPIRFDSDYIRPFRKDIEFQQYDFISDQCNRFNYEGNFDNLKQSMLEHYKFIKETNPIIKIYRQLKGEDDNYRYSQHNLVEIEKYIQHIVRKREKVLNVFKTKDDAISYNKLISKYIPYGDNYQINIAFYYDNWDTEYKKLIDQKASYLPKKETIEAYDKWKKSIPSFRKNLSPGIRTSQGIILKIVGKVAVIESSGYRIGGRYVEPKIYNTNVTEVLPPMIYEFLELYTKDKNNGVKF